MVLPVVTPEEMKAIDAAAPESVDVLVDRAGAAVARAARRMLGGTYGRRVVVVAGKGNNGADGRAAARRLARAGVRVTVVDAAAAPARLAPADLVVDAAYGTGFRGDYRAPDPGDAPVLAVDIPSGVDGVTGSAGEGAVRADVTVTFAALKPGLVLGEGCERAGRVELADIGLDVSGATMGVVESADVARWLPSRPREAHKWEVAVFVAAGSPGMTGAARLCARAALRAGAGSVHVGSPGLRAGSYDTGEAISRSLPAEGWDGDVLDGLSRFGALVVGPGLGRSEQVAACVRRLVSEAPVALVVDADGLFALDDADTVARLVKARAAPVVLTPHAGEFARLAGAPPGADRVGAARDLARRTGAVVVLKGSTTVVADPGGRVLLSTSGGPRLATAGTGDVLAGVLAAFLAAGVAPLEAAAAAAHVHGKAAHLGWPRGLVAGDVVDLLPAVLAHCGPEAPMPRSTPVRQVMTADVLTFAPDVGVDDAARQLVDRGIGGAPVVDAAGYLLGLVEDDDLITQEVRLHFPTTVSFLGALLQLPSEQQHLEDDLRKAVGATVGDVMDRDPATCSPDDTLETAATVMHDRQLSRLPVVDDAGRVVGILARGDVLRAIVRSGA